MTISGGSSGNEYIRTVNIGNNQKVDLDMKNGTWKIQGGEVQKIYRGGKEIQGGDPKVIKNVMKIVERALIKGGNDIDPNGLGKMKITEKKILYQSLNSSVNKESGLAPMQSSPKIQSLFNKIIVIENKTEEEKTNKDKDKLNKNDFDSNNSIVLSQTLKTTEEISQPNLIIKKEKTVNENQNMDITIEEIKNQDVNKDDGKEDIIEKDNDEQNNIIIKENDKNKNVSDSENKGSSVQKKEKKVDKEEQNHDFNNFEFNDDEFS